MPGNALQPIVLRAPGIGGLNFEGEGVREDPSFAQVAENIVFDQAGRICSRKGLTQLTDGGNILTGAPDIEQLHMMDTSSGNKLLATALVSATEKIYESASPYSSFTDVTGALTPATNNWQFVNFNDQAIGIQAGETAIYKTYGGASFATITAASGTVPQGNCIHSAFGRLWAQSSNTTTGKHTIDYCALLDETHWSTGGGSINVLGTGGSVAFGYDELTAISSFDKYLIAFLRNSIIIYNSPDVPGSLGIEQVIQGVGCIARDSVQRTGDDIIFLSATGLRSLKHTIESEDNLEFGDVSGNVRQELLTTVSQSSEDVIRSAYYPEDALYLLIVGGIVWAVDLHDRSVFGQTPPRITTFPVNTWTSACYHEGTLYLGEEGLVGTYSGYLDKTATYTMVWKSIWTDFGTSRFKSLKKINAVFEVGADQNITFSWATDYGLTSGNQTVTTTGEGVTSEWTDGTGTVSEWGSSEWSGGTTLSRISAHASRTGEVISFGLETAINDNLVCLEQLAAYATIGREAR